MKLDKKLAASFVLLALFAAACTARNDNAAEVKDGSKVKILASFYPLAEISRRVGGSTVEVTDLTPPGVEPHDIELLPRQVEDARDARLMFYVGGGFAPAVEAAAKQRTNQRNRPAIDVTRTMMLDKTDEPSETANDMHFWLDPVMMSNATRTVEQALVEALPGQAATIRSNAETYRAELQVLDDEYRNGLANCRINTIVTSHAAFHYVAKRYNFTSEAISLIPDAEPDAKQLSDLGDVIRKNKVSTVFTETLVSPRVAESLAREAKVKVSVLNPIEGLTDDQIAKNENYSSVMRQNLAALREARACH